MVLCENKLVGLVISKLREKRPRNFNVITGSDYEISREAEARFIGVLLKMVESEGTLVIRGLQHFCSALYDVIN